MFILYLLHLIITMKNIDLNMYNIDFIKISKVDLQYRIRNVIHPHRHRKTEMHFITSGHGYMEVNGKLFPIAENSFIITFSEDTHRLIAAKDCVFISQYTVFFDLTANVDIMRRNFRHGIKSSKGALVFPEVEKHWNSGNKLLRSAAEYRLQAFIFELVGGGEIAASNPYVEKAQNYMRNHVTEKISLHKLSRHVGLEKSYFCRLFKQVSNETPMHFFMHQKIELSKEMLNAGDRNSDIAAATGFADEFHFSRSFKKITGISPRQYRNTNYGT
jgi:AraC-like DNA-binding protein